MADTKISSLTLATAMGGAAVPAAQGGANVQIPAWLIGDGRNDLLVGCDIAKLLAAYQRKIGTFYDGYKANDGVASVTGGAVNTTSGYVGPSSAQSSVAQGTGTAIGNMTASGGIAAAFDGTTSQGTTSSARILNGTDNAATPKVGGYVGKDWGVGNTKTISGVSIYGPNNDYINNVSAGTTITVTLQGSTDNFSSSIVDLGNFTFTDVNIGTVHTQLTGFTTTTAYRYHRAKVQSSASFSGGAAAVAELVFYEGVGVNNMTVVTATQTADASVSSGRVLLEVDPIDAITLNTDLTAEVTCDNGSHWTAATLSSAGKGQSGRTVVETVDQATTAGTSFAARVKTLNNKNVNIYKAAMVVH